MERLTESLFNLNRLAESLLNLKRLVESLFNPKRLTESLFNPKRLSNIKRTREKNFCVDSVERSSLKLTMLKDMKGSILENLTAVRPVESCLHNVRI